MDQRIKKLWVERLRSSIRQGRGRLATLREDGEFEYCCLGVLCEIAIEEKVISSMVTEEGVFRYPSQAVRKRVRTFQRGPSGEGSAVGRTGGAGSQRRRKVRRTCPAQRLWRRRRR